MTIPETREKAQKLWEAMDKNQRHGIKFGLFPHEIMQAAEAEGYDSHTLTLALMECSTQNAGKKA